MLGSKKLVILWNCEDMQTFGDYMNEWLYGKGGYYRSDSRVGKLGDFYTSVSSSKFFGGVIAKYLLKQLEAKKLSLPLKIIEIGGDRGYLIADVAEFFATISQEIANKCEWISIESFDSLAKIQKKVFLKQTQLALHSYDNIQGVDIGKNDSVFIFCNELFDAFACEVIKDDKMAFVKNHQVVWGGISFDIAQLAEKYGIFEGEIPLRLESFFITILKKLEGVRNWEFLGFDYGDWKARNKINLRVYQNHCVQRFLEIEQNLEDFYQKSDVTYDVNFSIINEIFVSLGAKRLFYKTQGKALVEMGLVELLEDFARNVSYERYLREIGKIKPLISPDGLGERFKAISFCVP